MVIKIMTKSVMTARIRSSNEIAQIVMQAYKQIHNLHRGESRGGTLKKIAPS
jgi:hypothetical protein